MLSNLASYLMGGSTTVPSASAISASSAIAQGPVLPEQELQCTEDEDWLVVDPDAPGSSSHHTGVPSHGPSLPISISSRDEDNGYLEDDESETENCGPAGGLEESWRPKLATSPLENLLIEHPSMSVYHQSYVEETTTVVSPVPTIDEEEEIDAMEIEDNTDLLWNRFYSRCSGIDAKKETATQKHKDLRATTANTTPTVPHSKSQKVKKGKAKQSEPNRTWLLVGDGPNLTPSLTPQVQLEAAMLGGRVSQKKQSKVTRSQLERLNKCKSAGKPKRRSDRQHPTVNSKANNNRKCCQRMC